MERQSQKLIKPNGADDHINSSYLLTKFLPEGWGKKKKREEYETIKYGVCYITVVFFSYYTIYDCECGKKAKDKDTKTKCMKKTILTQETFTLTYVCMMPWKSSDRDTSSI